MTQSLLVWVWVLHVFGAAVLVAIVGAVAHWLTRGWSGSEGKQRRSAVFVALIAGFVLCRLLDLALPHWVQVSHYLAELIH